MIARFGSDTEASELKVAAGFNPLAKTPAARKRHGRAMDQMRDQHKSKAEREIRDALMTQAKQAVRQYRKGERMDIDNDPMRKAFATFTRDVFMRFALATNKAILSQKSLSDETMTLWERIVYERIVKNEKAYADMTLATLKILASMIQQGELEGLAVPGIANSIMSRLPEIAKMRATRIAQTEILAASNLGSLEGVRSTGLDMKKRWLSTGDDFMRDDHRDADGQVVGLDDNFTLGVNGDLLQYPGDPSAPAAQVINCRCTQIYEEV